MFSGVLNDSDSVTLLSEAEKAKQRLVGLVMHRGPLVACDVHVVTLWEEIKTD